MVQPDDPADENVPTVQSEHAATDVDPSVATYVPPAQSVLSFAPPAHQKPAGHTAPSSDKVAGGQYFDSLPHSLPLPGLVFDVVLLSAPGPVFDIVLLSLSEVQKANRILGHERPGWCYPTGRCAYLPSVTCYRQSIKPPPPSPPPSSPCASLAFGGCVGMPLTPS